MGNFDFGKAMKNFCDDVAHNTNAIVTSASQGVGQIGKFAGDVCNQAVSGMQSAAQNFKMPNITARDIVIAAMKVPGVKIDREKFLRSQLNGKASPRMINQAVITTPFDAGIPEKYIDKIANECINAETNKTTLLSAAAGLPGGLAMAATLPADLAQYYAYVLRILQKLAYLYGFGEFEIEPDSISDETMNELFVLLGVMMGISQANAAVAYVAKSASNHLAKKLAAKALTKTFYYPLIKKVANSVGIRMTKNLFAKGVSKAVPVVGAAVSGTLTYTTFNAGARRLKDKLKQVEKIDEKDLKVPDNVF